MEKTDNSPSETLRIHAFPEGQTAWRIDWFGDIAFPDRTVRRKQPSVFVHLSRVTDPRFCIDSSVLLSAQCTSPPKFQRRVWVSVGTLPLLRIGDIWRDRKLLLRPDYELEEFDDIQIDKSTTSLIKAGLNPNEDGFLLPLSEHPWHMQCTQSYCVMLEVPGHHRIIIPCMEIIRFYFGSSSSLISQLFLPPLIRETLFTNASLDYKSGRLKIELAERMSGASAADIGRISMEPMAWRAAQHIGVSCLKASTTQQAIHPQALFPFEGRTNLVASGKWLSFGDQLKATFLVYNLRSCAHPFPFNSLRYELKGARALRPKSPQSTESSDAHPQRVKHSAMDSRDQPLVEQDSSNKLAPKLKTFKTELRFLDLKHKTIWKNKTLSTASGSASFQTSQQSVDFAAVGEPGAERRVRPVDLALVTTTNAINSDAIPTFLREIVADLQSVQNIEIELLTESQHDGWSVPISLLANEDGEINPQLMIVDTHGTSRMRRASVFAFKRDVEHVCAVAIESSPVHVKIYTTTGETSGEVRDTLRCAAVDFLRGSTSDLETSSLSELIHWVFDV
ncbi:MAG: hypothetical protein Q8R67_08360 [Rhodoferax sp.]|nr:hypothetical protein [Rhodoferax sp.]MDP3651680.1 hypothetical protein [Rhodoferax sp.]